MHAAPSSLTLASSFSRLPALLAQESPAPAALAAHTDYSQEGFVFEKFATKLAFSANGTGHPRSRSHCAHPIPSRRAKLGVIGISYKAETERFDISYVRVRKPEGRASSTLLAKISRTSRQNRARSPHPIAISGKLRTSSVPSLPKQTASAEFFLLFSPAKIEDVQFISGKENLKDACSALREVHYDMIFPIKVLKKSPAAESYPVRSSPLRVAKLRCSFQRRQPSR